MKPKKNPKQNVTMTDEEVMDAIVRLYALDLHIGDCYRDLRYGYVAMVNYISFRYVQFKAGDQLTTVPRDILGDYYERMTT